MTRGTKPALSIAALAVAGIAGPRPIRAEIPLAEFEGWRLTTDGRINTYVTVADGQGIPSGQPEVPGAGVTDTATSTGALHSSRIRNGFLMDILAFTGQKELGPNFKVTARAALWMNISSSRTKNTGALVDPRELYGKIEGNWGSVLAGSHMALFGRGGIHVDADIAHDYGLGYPCSIRDVSGGGCGLTGFGAPFPGFEPGLVYTTPRVGGLQVSLGIYDPATIGNAQLNRAPLPRFEGEIAFERRNILRVFGSAFTQVIEGTTPAGNKDLHVNAQGVQVGAMVSAGPIMLGGAAYQGTGFGPITYLEEGILSADANGVLRNSRGAFGLGAVLINAVHLKVAGGGGVWRLDKTANDAAAVSSTGIPQNPGLIKQNLGMTIGLYQTTGPVHFALEYFRAQHTWYDRGLGTAADQTVLDHIVTPHQTLNFVNVGLTVTW